MYAGYFGLTQLPFSIAPDPRYLFMSERHREALAHLLYGVEGGGGFVLLSGEIGAGKTTICRCFLEQIPAHCNVAYIFNPKLTVAELLRTVCVEFHIPVPQEGSAPVTLKTYIDQLNEHLLRSHAAGQHNVLIIDEAQNLTPHVLEQLRLLTNLETSERKLLQIILIGQPELRQLLAQPELEQLAQRVIARFHLGALDEGETRQYVQHRMAVAGLQGPLPFSEAALRRVHLLTRGVPRRINLLCDRALLGAYASRIPRVERAVVDKAASEVFETADTVSPANSTPRVKRRVGSLLLGALGGAVSAAAVIGLWLPQLSRDQPPVPSPAAAAPEAPAGDTAASSRGTTPGEPAGEPAQQATEVAAAAPAPTLGLPPADALLRSETAGLRVLGSVWGHPLRDDDPCASAARWELQCYRTTRMTLNGLQQMDRPAVLQLHLPGQAMGWVVLTAMATDGATLHTGEQSWKVPLTALADTWRGEYATLWRTPPDQKDRPSATRWDPGVGWLAEQLQTLQTRGQVPADASDAQARIRAFQRTQGLQGDGLAGPMTLMLLNRAAGVDEPRLAPTAP
ncbi:MAG: AAA family ATPase [Hydrogenophaga sp.]|nr:AAA family ATPase [Hydrogenophaga sp.]